MRKGLTLPNRNWDRYTDAEMAGLNDLAPDVLVVLLYGDPIDTTHRQQLQSYIDSHHPRLIYRPYRDDIPLLDPVTWATRCDHLVSAFGYQGELIPDNERNLPVEHGSENWPAQITWLKAFARQWKATMPGTPLHLGALSPSGNWIDGLNAYRDAGLDLIYDICDSHAYGPNAPTQAEQVGAMLRGPIDVTEYNQILPKTMLDDLEAEPYQSATWFILGGTPDQAQYDILRQPDAYASFKAWRPMVADYDSPNHDGLRAQTLGIVLHATLGGSATPQTEYTATINWFANPASEVSAHAVVGPHGQVHRSVRPELIAWHARAANNTHLGAEMAKARLTDPIQDDILEETAQLVAGWCKDYAIPVQWSTTHGLAEHREMPGNDHQDVGGPFNRDDFIKRVNHYYHLGDDILTPEQKKIVLDDLDLLWAYSKADQTSQNPAESERVMHERIIGLKTTLGLNG